MATSSCSKNRTKNRCANKYSTAFSNKLIDLAISADAESLTSVNVQTEDVKVLPHTPENSSKESTEETAVCPQQATGPNLLTVFSAPCSDDYFLNPKQSSSLTKEDELPDYVKRMMEKDLALRRLVKTGSVTISQVKTEVGNDDDEYLDDEDFLDDDPHELNGNNNGDLMTRPFIPMGKTEDWETFPFAKRLLELAQLSLTVSTMVSPATTTAIVNDTIPVIKQGQLTSKGKLSKTIFKHPPRVGLSKPQGKFQQSRLSSVVPVEDKHPKVNGNSCKRTRNVQKKPGHFSVSPPPTTAEYDVDDCFHVDPMKFLEVSLQVGKPPVPPDDSIRRKYKCGFCDKKFCWSTDLRRHILIHTGERPFKCSTCAATFTRKFLMQKHIKKAHQSSTDTVTTYCLPTEITSDGTSFPTNEDEDDENGSDWNSLLTSDNPTPLDSSELITAGDSSFDYLEMDEAQSDDDGMELSSLEPTDFKQEPQPIPNTTYVDC